MCICRVKTCCGCLDLKTGCFIIAFVNIINAILVVITLIMICGVMEINHIYDDLRTTMSAKMKNIDVDTFITIIKVMLIFMIVVGLIHIAFVGTLLYALKENKRSWMRPFIIYQNILNTLIVLSTISALVTSYKLLNLTVIVSIPINIYFAIIVNSYYKSMGTTEVPTPVPETCDEENHHELAQLSPAQDPV